MKLLIDGDILVYRCGFAVEKTKYLITHEGQVFGTYDDHKSTKVDMEKSGGTLWSRKEVEPLENALHLVKQVLEGIGEGDREIYLSPTVGNYRDKVATRAKYKGNRDASHQPVHKKEIIEYLCDVWKAVIVKGHEADDEIGIRATECKKAKEDFVIVTIDKDLDQIPGKHYNWVTKETYEITPRQAAFNLYSQILSGDATDNVPGIEGIGPAKAAKILAGASSVEELWQRCRDAYEERYPEFGLSYCNETAHLVFIRRNRDDYWTPPYLEPRGWPEPRKASHASAT